MPILTVIAGPNGSGKSTLIEMLVRTGIGFGEYLNADDIAREMTSGSPQQIAADAQQIVRDRRAAALIEQRDHAFETVMSHPSHIEHMRMAARAGFEVRLYFIATEDPSINIDRVTNRVAHGGHDVPIDRIRSRYARTLDLLEEAIGASDSCEIFDNSSAAKPLRGLAWIVRVAQLANLTARGKIREDDAKRRAALLEWSAKPRSFEDRIILHLPSSIEADVPVWWLKILLRLKPDDPFKDGSLS